MDFRAPKLSATMETVKVLRWLKRVGDKVAIGEPLVELETDKAAMEVESPVEATLEAVLGAEGAELPAGAVLARLKTADEVIVPEPLPGPARLAVGATNAAGAPRVLASPFARRLAGLKGIDLTVLAVGRPFERIRGRDVVAAAEAREELAAVVPIGFEPLSAVRRQVAEAVALSRRTIPSFVLDRWVDTAAIERARTAHGSQIEKAVGVRPTLTDFLLRALVESFSRHPGMLDRWHEADGRAGRLRPSTVDIGLVVAVPGGVMIPALRGLGGRTIDEIARVRADAVERARSGRVLQGDTAPVSFSLSNLGKGGADRFEAIINPGQAGILAVGRQHERVIARSGGIEVAKGVNLTLTADHRLIDGLFGAQFLETLAERIEQANWRLA